MFFFWGGLLAELPVRPETELDHEQLVALAVGADVMCLTLVEEASGGNASCVQYWAGL